MLEAEREREEPFVLAVELFGDGGQAFPLELLQSDVDGEAQALAVVADVDLVAGCDLAAFRTTLLSDLAAARASSSRIERISRALVLENVRTKVRARSSRTAVVASPSAQSTPGPGGMMAGQEPSRRDSAFACRGPAPPKAISA